MSDILNSGLRGRIDTWLERFPAEHRRSAVLGALREVQKEYGHLTPERMDAVADYLGLPTVQVYEVGSFYTGFEHQPVGRHTVAVCTNISCWLRGGEEILAHIEKSLGIRAGESTRDGRIYLKSEEECLAGCCGAPMMQVDHVYHENLTLEKVDKILGALS